DKRAGEGDEGGEVWAVFSQCKAIRFKRLILPTPCSMRAPLVSRRSGTMGRRLAAYPAALAGYTATIIARSGQSDRQPEQGGTLAVTRERDLHRDRLWRHRSHRWDR